MSPPADNYIVLLQVVGLALRLGRPWSDTTQRRTSGRSSAAWRYLVITLAAVSYKVCSGFPLILEILENILIKYTHTH